MSETWELLGGARRVDDGWRGWGALDGARQSPPPAEESGGKPSPFPAEESALAREMASLFGVARAEPRRLGGRDFCVVRSRRNPAVALLLVRLTLPTGESVTSETPGNPRRFRARTPRWSESSVEVGVPPAASPESTGVVTSGVLGGWRGMNVMDVVRMSNRLLRNFARKPGNVHRRAFATWRRATIAARDARRVAAQAELRSDRWRRARETFAARRALRTWRVLARTRAAGRAALVASLEKARALAWKDAFSRWRRKAAERRDDRKTTARAVRVVSRACTSRAFAAWRRPRVRQRRGEVRVREGIVAVATTGEGATVSSVARAREVSHRRARCAPSRFRTRLQTRAAPTRVARVFALASVDDVGKSSENRRTRGDAHVRASRRDARDARLARGIGARAARARRRRTRPTRVGSNPSAPRVFVFLGVAIFDAPRDGSRARDVASTRRRMFAARGFKNMVHVPKDEARARATPRDDALETVRHEARDRSVDVRARRSRLASSTRLGDVSRVARRVRTNLRRGHVSREMRPRGAETIGNGDASRRVSRVARVRARRTSRARRRGSIDAVREEEGFSPRVFVRLRVAIRGGGGDHLATTRGKDGVSARRGRHRGRVREVGSVRARLRDGAATRATRDGSIPRKKTRDGVFRVGARRGGVGGASRARRRGPPRRRRRARGERASGDDSSRARGASGGSRDSSSSPRGV